MNDNIYDILTLLVGNLPKANQMNPANTLVNKLFNILLINHKKLQTGGLELNNSKPFQLI